MGETPLPLYALRRSPIERAYGEQVVGNVFLSSALSTELHTSSDAWQDSNLRPPL